MLTVEHVFDDGELCLDGWGLRCGAVAFESGDDIECFFILALADEQARRIG